MRNIIIIILANLLVVAGMATAAVTSFTLVNADTNADIQTIPNGAVINLSALGTTNLNIRANVDNAPNNVVITLSGATSRSQTEGVAPYALWGDTSGNYAAGSLNLGQHTLSGTPAGGSAFTVNFTVTNSVTGPPTVSSGTDKALTLPASSTSLNGVASDDGSIVSYTWSQQSGPSTATLNGQNTAVLTASNLIAGTYVMRLTVTDDDGNSSSDEARIVVSGSQPVVSGAFVEAGGVVVMEVESVPAKGQWESQTAINNYSGTEYYNSKAGSGSGGADTLSYVFTVTNAGNYQVQVRSRIAEGNSNTDANDSFIRLVDASDTPITPIPNQNTATGSWYKFYQNTLNNWSWQTSNKDFDPKPIGWTLAAGQTYKLQISRRSKGHAIDKIVIWNRSMGAYGNTGTGHGTTAQLDGLTESARSTGGSLIYNARQDFPDTNQGEVPYYLDVPNDALAIDASNVAYRDKFARAELTFGEDSAVYDVAITTLTEEDGESDYRLLKNGVVVGTYKNPRVTAAGDLQANVHVWRGIMILTGDTLAVESKAHTNGLIPEGGGTAWSRGRWRQIELSTATGGSNDGDGSVTIQGEMKQWHRVDLRQLAVHSSEQAAYNPFSNYRMDVTFTAPSGKTYLVPGYFATDGNGADEGNIWMAHLNPSETGQWSYNVSFRVGADVAVSLDANAGSALSPFNGKTGTFVVSASDKTGDDLRAADKGMLINRGDHYLTYGSNGKPFLYTGPGIPENILGYRGFTNTTIGIGHEFDVHEAHWNSGDPDWNGGAGKKLIGALNYIANEGGNCLYMMSNTIGGDGQDCFPHPTSSTTKDRYDLLKLKQWDIALSHAQKKGIFLHWHLAEHETGNNTYYGGSGAGNQNVANTMTVQRKLHFRMLNAVFGHYNGLKWNIMEECEFTPEDRTAQMEYIKAIDPYDHAVTYQVGGIGIGFNTYDTHLGETDGIDASSFQGNASRESMFNTIQSWRVKSANNGVKWTCAWDEPQRIDNDNTDQNQGYPMGRRDKMWPCLMGGGDGFMWYIQKDGGGHGFDQRIEDFTIMQSAFNWSEHVRTFLKDLPLLEMNSSLSLVTSGTGIDYTLAKSNQVYAIYNDRSGSGMSLDLSGTTGQFSVRWFDPRSGGALQNGTVNEVTGGSTVSLGNPPSDINEDWAVLVERVVDGITYSLTVESGSGDGEYSEGGNVTIVADPAPQGKVFDQWVGDVASVTDIRAASTTLTMPTEDITVTATYKDGPAVQIAINCGGNAFVASDGTSYEADNYFTGGTGYVASDAISGTTDDTLYQSERYGNASYAVPVPNGNYQVFLQFAEIYETTNDARRFSSTIEGGVVIGNLDIHSKVGHDAAHNVLISGVNVTDGVMNITLVGIKGNSKLSAFRIISANAGIVDEDGDGIDDFWEMLYFGNLNTATATSDSDGDGSSDLSESQSKTSPTDSGSFFGITKFQAAGAESFSVEWNGSTSATYRVETSTDLSVWSTFAEGISGKENNSIVIATQGSKMFVRVAEE